MDCGELPLRGRRALVTGAATGIGRATAQRLARDGASVVINYRGERHTANEVPAAIATAVGNAQAIPADVSDQYQR